MYTVASSVGRILKIHKAYSQLTKPGLVFFVLISAYVNYEFADRGNYPTLNWLYLLLGIYLAASGAHAVNQALEHNLDSKMSRTASRPVPAGIISPLNAFLLGAAMGLAGVILHFVWLNFLTALVTLLAFLSYAFVYTPLKTKTIWNTWLGAIPGAMASLSGWVALRNDLSAEAFVLPLLIFFWQMPHFLSLSWKYRLEYQKAGFKMLANADENGLLLALLAFIHALLMVEVSLFPYFLGEASIFYFFVSLLSGIWFIFIAFRFVLNRKTELAGKMFILSNFYLIVIFTAVLIDRKFFNLTNF